MELETERLLLRDWSKNDIPDLVDGLNNLEVSKWLAFVPHPYTSGDAENWIDYCNTMVGSDDKRNSYMFAIELKSERKVIGGVGLESINLFQGTAKGGIWINQKYCGKGYGTEAFKMRLEFAFNHLKLRRLENGLFDGNIQSLKMQERFGYQVEGKKRKSLICMATGEVKDEYITGLLKEEWKFD